MITLFSTAQNIINKLNKNGHEAYAVGGSVRNTIMGLDTKGWDFTTDAKPSQILKIFPDSFYDNKFGTVGIKIYKHDKHEKAKPDDIYEITTFRSEGKYSDFRHPDKISWGKSLDQDLARRDFTINAIATDGKKIFDPFNGKSDIDKKIIKAVGDPNKRFQEDALRMIRAIRIATQLEFLIDQETNRAITKNKHLLQKISKERIHDELLKILGSSYPADGILLMRNTKILKEILPELDDCFGVEQKSPKRHHIYDVGTHLVMSLKHCPSSDPIVRMATLLHDIGKAKTQKIGNDGVITFYNHEVVSARLTKNIIKRLRFSKNDSQKIYKLVRWHQFSVDEKQTDSAIRRIIRKAGKENITDLLKLRIGDRLGGGARETSWRLELFKKRLIEVQKQPFTVSDLKISGHDVMKELNIAPGRKVGEILDELFKLVISKKLPNEKDALIKKLKVLKK